MLHEVKVSICPKHRPLDLEQVSQKLLQEKDSINTNINLSAFSTSGLKNEKLKKKASKLKNSI